MKKGLLIGLVMVCLTASLVQAASLNKDMRQRLERVRTASEVYDRNGQLMGNLYFYRQIWTPLPQIPKSLQQAVIAIEDARFYQHQGVDPRGMARATLHNLIPGGPLEGGSTITQQLAKITLLSSDRNIIRKAQDINLAIQIEQVYTKQEILELYLNSIYLAHGNVGVEAAARYYFGKSVNQLSLGEVALLAGLIQSPENYSPVRHPRSAKTRRDLVLQKMREQGYITKTQYNQASISQVKIIKRSEAAASGAYFFDYVREYLVSQAGFSEEELRFGGYKIYTTLDPDCQRQAEQAILGVPHNLPAKVQPQGALVSLDPQSGAILALVGGRDYGASQYNRAVKSYRQPGSAIKPFVYATALEKGWTAASIIEDKPLNITLPSGRQWAPANYDHKFQGRVSLRQGLRHSINLVAVQLLQQVGIAPVVELMERMGIDSLVKTGANNDLNLAPLALGGLTKGVTPLELAAAYLPFASQGNYLKPFAVSQVLDHQGNLLKEYSPESRRALSPQTAYIMTSLMQDVIEKGTGQRARLPDRAAAGKTGTTSDYTNAWFVGYTPDLVTAVWIGNDRQDQPMSYSNGNIGSAIAALIWGNYMRQVTANRPVLEFKEPSGIVWEKVNQGTGEIDNHGDEASTYLEVFNEEALPGRETGRGWHWFFSEKPPEADAK